MRKLRKMLNPKAVLLLILVLVSCTLYTSNYSNAASSSELQQKQDAIIKELQSYNSKQQQVSEKIKQINSQKLELLELSKLYDQQLADVQKEIDSLNSAIAVKKLEIASNEEKLQQTMVDRDNQYEAMKLRIKYMYERGEQNEMEILLSAKDLGDMLNKSEYVEKITEYDRAMLDKLIETENNIREAGEVLAKDKKILELQHNAAASNEKVIQSLIVEKQKQMNALSNSIGSLTSEYNNLSYEVSLLEKERVNNEIALKQALAAEEEARKQAAANGKDPNVGMGKYDGHKLIWPTNARPVRITCPFAGYPGHRGTDIAPTPGRYDDKAIAASTGIVIYSQLDPGGTGGNMICIKISDDVVLWYKHLSAMYVKVGDVVTTGEIIGQMGATGMATGQHLHFEVDLNGVPVNAMPYLQLP